MSHFSDQLLSLFRLWFITTSKVSGLGLDYPKDVSSANNIVKERRLSPISFT